MGHPTASRSCLRTLTLIALAVWATASGCLSRQPADPARSLGTAVAVPPVEWPKISGKEPSLGPANAVGLQNLMLLTHGLYDESLVRNALLTKGEIVGQKKTDDGLLIDAKIFRRKDWDKPSDQRTTHPPRRLLFMAPGVTLAEAMNEAKVEVEDGMREWADLPADNIVFDVREPSGEPRGMIIWYHSLGGLIYEESILQEFQRRGWLIAVAGFPWGADGDLVLPVVDEDVTPQARLAARSVDRRLAIAASAAHAAREYLLEARPGLREKPLVLWGASAGSFCTPAVAARFGPEVRAVILIGAGANLLAVSQTSTFFDGGIKFVPVKGQDGGAIVRLSKGKLAGQPLEQLLSTYIENSVLDPYVLAPRLASTPVLMLHAAGDEIVPAVRGEQLWERLAKPERWVLSGGHQVLFWRLSSFRDSLADWLDFTLAPAATTDQSKH